MKSIFDRSFHYTPAASTDLKKTFARVRRERRDAATKAATPEKEGKLLRFRALTRRAGT